MQATKPQSKVIWYVAGVVTLLLGLVIYLSIAKPGSPPGPIPLPDCLPEIDNLVLKAHEFQTKKEWDAAKKEWDALAARTDLCPQQRQEVALNRQVAAAHLQPLETTWERPKGDTKGAPDKAKAIPPMHFLDYYQPGRTVDSNAEVTISGKGTNLQWFIQSEVSFVYQYKLQARTTVVENRGESAVFEMKFGTVEQIRAVTQLDSLSLRIPEDSVVGIVVPIIDDWMQDIPGYRIFRRPALWTNAVDPGLERSLTAFAQALNLGGRPVKGDDEVEFARQVMELSGQKLRIEYDRDEGIQKIDDLAGKGLPKETLASLAHNSSLLLDYYLFPAAEQKVGSKWVVDAAEVAGLFADSFSTEAAGKIDVQRDKDDTEGEQLANLRVVGGEVKLTVRDESGVTESFIKPKKSTVKFSIKDKLVRQSHIEWDIKGDKTFPLTHLLFGTKSMRQMEFKTDYKAKETKKRGKGGPTSNKAAQ